MIDRQLGNMWVSLMASEVQKRDLFGSVARASLIVPPNQPTEIPDRRSVALRRVPKECTLEKHEEIAAVRQQLCLSGYLAVERNMTPCGNIFVCTITYLPFHARTSEKGSL